MDDKWAAIWWLVIDRSVVEMSNRWFIQLISNDMKSLEDFLTPENISQIVQSIWFHRNDIKINMNRF